MVGAGIGGLAAAIDLASRGEDVTVLERAPAVGGKMRQIAVAGRAIDAGPTVFTMRWVFEDLFADAGTDLSEHLALRPARTLARHAWEDGSRLDLHADRAASADAIGAFAGAKEAEGYLAFCKQARQIYQTLERPFIRAPRPTVAGLVLSTGPLVASRLKPFTTLWDAIGRHMKDARLRQLFGRYATYCGTSPFQAPATLMLVAHVEQEGVWLVDGGMFRVAEAMAALAEAKGAAVRTGAHVAEIMVASGRVRGVRLEQGEVLPADAVIMNGEPTALANGLLGDAVRPAAAPVRPPQRSLSAVTWAAAAETSGLELVRHTVCFSADYRQEFELIGAGKLPTAPTTYICAQDRGDPGDTPELAPDRTERLLILVNAPANGGSRGFSQVEIDQCTRGMFGVLNRCGVRLRMEGAPVMTTPSMFDRLFPASGGALYGAATNGGWASFNRPEARTKVPGLYLAGGSAHPGAGVPMAALSGRQAAAALLADRVPASTRKSRAMATSGGTSTR